MALDFWRREPLNAALADQWMLPRSPAYPLQEASYLRYLSDHLGYRLELQRARVPQCVVVGGSLSFDMTLINRGFAAPINQRPVLVAMVKVPHGAHRAVPLQSRGSAPIELGAFSGADVRDWQPYLPGDPYFHAVEHTLSFGPLPLPTSVSPGLWRLGLFLPDARAAAHDSDARFSIRLANDAAHVDWWTAPAAAGTGSRYGINMFATLNVTE